MTHYVVSEPAPRLPLVNGEAGDFLRQHGIVFFQHIDDEGRASGFTSDGLSALKRLAEAIFEERPKLQTGTRFDRVVKALANILVGGLGLRPRADINEAHVSAAEDAIDKWFEEASVRRKYLVPCTITPWSAAPFSVGPVHFLAVSDLAKRENVTLEALAEMPKYSALMLSLVGRTALWFAEVETVGLDEVLAAERADFAVDIALAALHIALPLHASRDVARINGRTRPNFVGTFFITPQDGRLHGGLKRREPNMTVSGELFDQLVTRQQALIESVGRRVKAYIDAEKGSPKLEQAWSDAAFWLHEGLAEPLSTVAIAKLETSAEVLFSAESTKNSSKRFYEAFNAFYGLTPHDRLRADRPQTVKQLVDRIVGARSKILHGTASTLVRDAYGEDGELRDVIELLVLEFMARFTLELDQFLVQSTFQDDTRAFLGWIKNSRQAPS
ncbi:hypothetical protein [Paraburkholderia xenovorans]